MSEYHEHSIGYVTIYCTGVYPNAILDDCVGSYGHDTDFGQDAGHLQATPRKGVLLLSRRCEHAWTHR
jgi:hypothetical protein